ncbi:MAG: c-type cytochrome [Pseudomonadota bacterium]
MLTVPRNRALLAGAAALALAVALVTAVFIGPFGRDTQESGRDDQEQVTVGGRVYAERCASCHGANLEGQPNWRERKPDGKLPAPPHDASGHTWHHPDQALIGITRDGLALYAPPGYQSDMPAFVGVLSDEEIAAVVAYIRSAWPEEIRNRQAAITRAYDAAQE